MFDYDRKVYTVGHSNHEIEYFIELLQTANINCVIDVRSTPMSSYSPQYNLETLKAVLQQKGIYYMHFGEEFGARHRNPDLWDNEGKVDFREVQKSRAFQNGIERVDVGLSKGFTIALMCSEGNPLDCHRFSMISAYLVEDDFEVHHILKDKTIATHEELLQQLKKKYAKKIEQPSLFKPQTEADTTTQQIYRLHNKEVGWSDKFSNENNPI